MTGLYVLKPWFTRVLTPVVDAAVARRVSPNVFTAAGVLAAVCFYQQRELATLRVRSVARFAPVVAPAPHASPSHGSTVVDPPHAATATPTSATSDATANEPALRIETLLAPSARGGPRR